MKNELLLSAAILPLCGMAAEVHGMPSDKAAPASEKHPNIVLFLVDDMGCLLYTSPSPRDCS